MGVLREVQSRPESEEFPFTLKNPHNIPARRFALRAEKKDAAIFCRSDGGPNFCDIAVDNNCNASTASYAYFNGEADSYTNGTGRDGQTFFTGSEYFQVKEIEVFEIS
jgi:hypothetical protein